MLLLADTHAHIYNIYDLRSYINDAFDNFKKLSEGCEFAGVLFLTQSNFESPDFDKIITNLRDAGDYLVTSDETIIKVQTKTENSAIFLVAGKQFVSSEKIEVLALIYNFEDLNGMKVGEILQKINELSGIAVLPWSPGKWLGKRGEIVNTLIEQSSENLFLIGDIPMRSFLNPVQFTKAVNKNIGVLCGSDSLPMKGEQIKVATYINVFKVNDDFELTTGLLRDFLKNNLHESRGKRDPVFKAIYRWSKFFVKSRIY